jgi:hypothetical protein
LHVSPLLWHGALLRLESRKRWGRRIDPCIQARTRVTPFRAACHCAFFFGSHSVQPYYFCRLSLSIPPSPRRHPLPSLPRPHLPASHRTHTHTHTLSHSLLILFFLRALSHAFSIPHSLSVFMTINIRTTTTFLHRNVKSIDDTSSECFSIFAYSFTTRFII